MIDHSAVGVSAEGSGWSSVLFRKFGNVASSFAEYVSRFRPNRPNNPFAGSELIKLSFSFKQTSLCLLHLLLSLTGLIFSATSSHAVPNNNDADWPSFGGQESGGQFSTATAIDESNVRNLARAWSVKTGDIVDASPFDGGTSFQATPILWNKRLYICTPLNRILALDAKTGTQSWAFDAHEHISDKMPRIAGNCRGVAIAADEGAETSEKNCAARIYRGDVFGNFFAVDAKTGSLCPDFGAGGIINVNDFDNKGRTGLFLSSPPAIYNDLVILGSGVGDNMFANADDGIVRALDSKTGELVWEFNPIPPELSDRTGGANVWSMLSVDNENGLVFLPTSSPSVDPYGGARNVDIPYANAVVALDAKTGEVIWHQQLVRHDLFDYDLPSQPVLSELSIKGKTVPVVIQITKMGFAFIFNRMTGEPIFPLKNIAVPESDVPGEYASPTQRIPVAPEPFSRQAMTREDVWGLTPIDRASCLSQFDKLRNEGIFTPPSLQGTLQIPSALGGGNWGGASYDASSNLLIVKTQNLASIIKLVPADPNEERELGSPIEFLQKPLNETPYRLDGEFFMSSWGVPCTSPPWGELVAIDLSKGTKVWNSPLGRVPFGPFHLSKKWGSPNVGGPMMTAGGLIFVGAGMDNSFRAIDVTTGQQLWQDDKLPAPVNSVPMTYEIDGEQFVVVTAGGNALLGTDLSDTIVAYRIGEEKGWFGQLLESIGLD
ncbi:MAG: pyrroloquinoline quinone-dependent dehydrogenase [Erythrobacter sp.]